uniref:Uncharacterized protein n=1 Tax=Setaria italica TaxID=4555 RepID=K4ANB6_SETIT
MLCSKDWVYFASETKLSSTINSSAWPSPFHHHKISRF